MACSLDGLSDADVLVADGIAPRKAKNARENSVASGSTALPPEAGPSSRKRKMAEVKEEDQVAQNLLGPTDDDIERMEVGPASTTTTLSPK